MRLLVTTAASLLLAAGTARADDNTKDAVKNLEGAYKVISVTGQQEPANNEEFVIKTDAIISKVLGDEPVKFTLDPSRTPAHIDISVGPTQVPGIYEFGETDNGTELKIALGKGPRAERPKDFDGKGEGEVVLKLRKIGFLGRVWTIIVTLVDPRNLTNPDAFKAALNQPGVQWSALVAVTLIVFTETGLLIGFLLPGDSLLVVLGIVAQLSGWNLLPFLVCLCAAAIIGDTVGYWIGYKAGPAIFSRPSSRFFKQEYLLRAKAFYERHGGKTIILARFVPIVRTFVPVVAGAAKMEYRTFLFYNVFGGIGWIVSMILFGYYLIPLTDPPMQRLLGNPNFTWAKHIDKVVIVVVLISVLPIAWKAGKHWLAKRKAKTPPPPGAAVEPTATAPVSAAPVEAPKSIA